MSADGLSVPRSVELKRHRSEEFGLSNYAAWEVAEIVGICRQRGFVVPTVYQGPYNLIFRACEAE